MLFYFVGKKTDLGYLVTQANVADEVGFSLLRGKNRQYEDRIEDRLVMSNNNDDV